MNNYQQPNVPNQTPCGGAQQRFGPFPEFPGMMAQQPQMGFGFQQPGFQQPGFQQVPIGQPPFGQVPGFPPPMQQQPVQAPFIEQSYIENILRLNRGKLATVYMNFENSQWGSKVFQGIIEAAGKDHIILSDPNTGMRYLLLMIYLNYVTFDEPIEYEYPFGIPTDVSGTQAPIFNVPQQSQQTPPSFPGTMTQFRKKDSSNTNE